MADTFYAWTRIKAGDKTVNPGDKVTAKTLGVDDEEFDQLLMSRAVRRAPYPNMPSDYTGSPREFILEERKRQLEDIDDLEDALAAANLGASQEADELVDPEDDNEPEDDE